MRALFFLLAVLLTVAKLEAQTTAYPIVMYNCENLFDCKDDSLTADEEFTPNGARFWTPRKYWVKIKNIGRTLALAHGWENPAIVGLCEIENESVIKDLIYNSQLEKIGFKYIHRNSPDKRGIDVAMLYNPKIFTPDTAIWITVEFEDSTRTTREILHVAGHFNKNDSVDFLINHWPSKYGGSLATETSRKRVASLIVGYVNALKETNPNRNIIIMGDFNEPITGPSVEILTKNGLTSLIAQKNDPPTKGSTRYGQFWETIDHIFVTEALLSGKNNLMVKEKSAAIVDLPFLIESDNANGGTKPFRTYIGFKYQSGYSDHLPVKVTLTTVEKK